jgi:hypothetical protein
MTTNHAAKITAQIACEYIINEPAAGWMSADRRAVLATAIECGVGEFYLDLLAAEIQCAAMRDDSDSTGAPL